MKGKKTIVLISALLLPAAIFVFLKIFGRNEFQVRPLLQEGEIDAPTDCAFEYSTPYRVADSVVSQLGIDRADSLYVIYFDPGLAAAVRRVSVGFAHAPVQIVPPSAIPAEIDRKVLIQCVLLMEPPASVVLLDWRNRIRGYYEGSDRDEIDRLLVEIDIILKNY